MKFKVNITDEIVEKLFEINGVLYWKEKPCKNKFAGDKAGTIRSDGYIQIRVNGTIYLAHRIIWFIHNKSNPYKFIDHINQNTSDNRIENLRLVDHSINAKNSSLSKNNTSGTVGIDYMKNKGKFRARITIDGISTHLGMFSSLSEAISARKNAEVGSDFTNLHGTKKQNKKYKEKQ